ncbi:hypothetical protein [Marinobacter similis]|uniref:Uncharacterized protein n=1 Tax=Marinobacter similis TaxID=1420916 RepID=W5YLE9_9GAMM|nr:hypothetical protein [Marinobacter similis]AHI30042.1 hypothetical protein AU14_06255 [Marinobacter similis]
MDTEPLLNITNGGQLAVLLAGAALLLSLLALWLGAGAKRSASRDIDGLRQKIGSMGREVDEIRVSQFNAPEREPRHFKVLRPASRNIAPKRAPTTRSGRNSGSCTTGSGCSCVLSRMGNQQVN